MVGRNAQTKQIVLEVPLFASGRVSIVCEYSWLELSVSGVLVCLRLSFSLKRRSVMQDEVSHTIKQHVEDSTFQKWQHKLDRYYQTISWLDCSSKRWWEADGDPAQVQRV